MRTSSNVTMSASTTTTKSIMAWAFLFRSISPAAKFEVDTNKRTARNRKYDNTRERGLIGRFQKQKTRESDVARAKPTVESDKNISRSDVLRCCPGTLTGNSLSAALIRQSPPDQSKPNGRYKNSIPRYGAKETRRINPAPAKTITRRSKSDIE